MSDKGYIYVLINPSMKGFIKVGKTIRDPTERANELSTSTGVPTPFFVGYQVKVNNCTRAELFVHTALDKYRVNENREFFNTSMTEAINAIMRYVKIDEQYDDEPSENKKHFINGQINEFKIEENLADDYYNGTNGQFRDYADAMIHYKKAFELGSANACLSIGSMYRFGEGVKSNLREALQWYKEGLKRKANGSYYNMLHIYLELKEFDNARKCLIKIFNEDNLFFISFGTIRYLQMCHLNNIDQNLLELDLIQKNLLKIKDYLNEQTKLDNKHQDLLISAIHILYSECEYYHLQPIGIGEHGRINIQKELLKAYKSGHYKHCPKCRKICFENTVICPVCGEKII